MGVRVLARRGLPGREVHLLPIPDEDDNAGLAGEEVMRGLEPLGGGFVDFEGGAGVYGDDVVGDGGAGRAFEDSQAVEAVAFREADDVGDELVVGAGLGAGALEGDDAAAAVVIDDVGGDGGALDAFQVYSSRSREVLRTIWLRAIFAPVTRPSPPTEVSGRPRISRRRRSR